MNRLTLKSKEAALLAFVTRDNNLVSVSVTARLTPYESEMAVKGLQANDLVVVSDRKISLTELGRQVKEQKSYEIKELPRVRLYHRSDFYGNTSNLATEKLG